MPRKMKPIWKSRTIQGVALTLVGVVANAPDWISKGSQIAQVLGHPEWSDAIEGLGKILIVVGPIISAQGRTRQGDLYTPEGLPGPNKPNFIP